MADLEDVTQAWYFTGEALSDQNRDGTPWADDRLIRRTVDTTLGPVVSVAPATPVVPAKVEPPPTLPEPKMASMLLVGLVLIFLRIARREERFD